MVFGGPSKPVPGSDAPGDQTQVVQSPVTTSSRLNIFSLLKMMIERGASDLHLSAGTMPHLRIDGRLQAIKTVTLTPQDTRALCYAVLKDPQKAEFEANHELDLSFGVEGLSRFRANIYLQRGAVSAAFRAIPFRVKSFGDLGLPRVLADVVRRPRGLVLVTGPTGSGKSTSVAALVDLINVERQGHIIMLEDPIEYLHAHKSCIINQRELGADTKSLALALKHVLRQDPDVVVIGELSDKEAIEAALGIGETGRLAIATLHTSSTLQTINRLIDVFPPFQQPQVRTQIAQGLEAIVCQQLLPKVGGGRALAMEIFVPTPQIRNLIRSGAIAELEPILKAGKIKTTLQTLNQSLLELIVRRQVEPEEALQVSYEPEELKQMIQAAQASPLRPLGTAALGGKPALGS